MFLISVRWNFSKFTWFWVTIVIAVAVDVALIVFVPWPSGKGIHGPVLAPVGVVIGGLDYLAVKIAMKLKGQHEPDELFNNSATTPP